MASYPLIFGRRELVEGNGFIAGVALTGRALLTQEDGEFWVEGINPGGFAANGKSESEALAKFCEEFKLVLFDIASEAPTFEEFKADVERFFSETSRQALSDWESAVQAVRRGEVEVDWLIQKPADSPLSIEVVLLQERMANPAHNREGVAALAA